MREVVIKKVKLPIPDLGMSEKASNPVVLFKIDHFRKTISFYKIKGSDPDITDITSLFQTDRDLSLERCRFVNWYNQGFFDGCTTERVIGASGCEYLHLRSASCAWASKYVSPKFSLRISMFKKIPCNGEEWDIDDFLLLTAETGWWSTGRLQKPKYIRINGKSVERQVTVKHD